MTILDCSEGNFNNKFKIQNKYMGASIYAPYCVTYNVGCGKGNR